MKKHFIISLSITAIFMLAIGLTLNQGMAQTSTNNTNVSCRNLTTNFYFNLDLTHSAVFRWASATNAQNSIEASRADLAKFRADVAALHTMLEREGISIAQSEKTARNMGLTTAAGVSALQEKYRSQLLTPRGLTHGTGVVDRPTRELLNQKYGCIERAKIDIINPYNNVIRGKGEKVLIRWTASGIPNTATLNINYVKEDGTGTTTITTQTVRNGTNTFDWTIPSNIPVGRYRIQASLSGSVSSDVSRAVFEVRDSAIEVSTPADGQVISVGQRVAINWRTGTAVGPDRNVTIQLVNEPSSTSSPYILNIATVRNSGTYTWVVPERIGTTNIANGSRHRILVSGGAGFSGYSPGFFTINSVVVTKPSITITAPSAQSIVRGQSVELRWSSLNMPAAARMSIRLVPNGSVGATSTLASNILVTAGSRSVTIPATTPPGEYRLEIMSSGVTPETSVLRSPVLTVTQQSVALSVDISGTTSVVKGGTIPVKWTGSGIANNTNVTIELINSTNSAFVTGTRLTRPFSAGSAATAINLNVPANITNGSYKVKISANADSRTITSESAAVTIASGSIGFSTSSVPTITATRNSSGISTAVTARFVMNISSVGGVISKPVTGELPPVNSNFEVVFVGPNGEEVPATGYTVTMSPNTSIGVGKTGRATIVARIPGARLPTAGEYKAYIKSYRLSIDGSPVNKTFSASEISTPAAVTIVK